jgi:twitching motility protein PilT
MNVEEMLKYAVDNKISDVFIVAGFPAAFKKNGAFLRADENKITAVESERLIRGIYQLAKREIERFLETGDDDFSFSIVGVSRFRVSAYKQRGSLACVIRTVPFGIPDYRLLNIPEAVMGIAKKTKGLVLVTGTAGSGKSTTLACIIDRINNTRSGHIITLEDPIEYLHRNNKCIVSQREIQLDTESYVSALRACLRQAPDVILLGEMRDYETIKTAMTAAETGHLVISTLHTVGAANTIDRVIDVFPPNQQQQIRVQLAMLLQCVISQQLLPCKDGSMIPAFEIMNANSAVRNIIRDSKVHQLDTVIATSASEGMISMDSAIQNLYNKGYITRETALQYAMAPDSLAKKLG